MMNRLLSALFLALIALAPAAGARADSAPTTIISGCGIAAGTGSSTPAPGASLYSYGTLSTYLTITKTTGATAGYSCGGAVIRSNGGTAMADPTPAPAAGLIYYVVNGDASAGLTLTALSGVIFAGSTSATTLVLAAGQTALIAADGTNQYVIGGNYGGGQVASFNGRKGAVVPAAGDYTIAQITGSGTGIVISTSGTLSVATSLQLSQLASQSANIVVGTTAAGAPSALAMPSCSGANQALTWTAGTGFGCATIGGTGGFNPAAPGPIGGTTPSTAAFTAATASTLTASTITDAGMTTAGIVTNTAAGQFSTSTAIPNGTTATTQAPGTNNATVATMAALQAAVSSASAPVLRDYIGGLVLANDAANPNTVIDISAGQATDSTNVKLMSIAAWTKSMSSFATGSGNGGLDTGTVAPNTWYHAHLISNAGATTTDVLISLSATAPTMPSGFTLFRRIGSILTNSSSQIVAFKQDGQTFYWGAPVLDINNTNPGISARTLYTITVPTGVKVRPLGRFSVANGNNSALIVTSPDMADLAPSATAAPGFDVYANTLVPNGVFYAGQLYTNTTAQLGIRESVSDPIYWMTAGWIDDRGIYN
jgi:hypothetical protein